MSNDEEDSCSDSVDERQDQTSSDLNSKMETISLDSFGQDIHYKKA
eukprot:TRINITY_DN15303_c0_g1_i1.p3 TRINITY_DN15303_c0_g1~~TRINITY_DN15303_c0_g1_i1.p3  ORF type:complete len:53 (+),score=15.37 TRINITY_DN15303_c0_g1_i1:22-159(+)